MGLQPSDYEESKDFLSECLIENTKFYLEIQDFGVGIPVDKLENLFIDFGNLKEHKDQNQ